MKVNKIVKCLMDDYGWSADSRFTDMQLELIKDVADIVKTKIKWQGGENVGVENLVTEKITDVDDYLRKVTIFIVNSKENLKSHVNAVIDEKFEFIEKDIKKANEAIAKIKSNFSL